MEIYQGTYSKQKQKVRLEQTQNRNDNIKGVICLSLLCMLGYAYMVVLG